MIVEKILERVVTQRKVYKKTAFSASSAGDCRRSLSYEMRGTTRDPLTAQRLMLLEDGNMHHSDVRQRISQVPGLKLSSVEKEYRRSYKKDGIEIQIVGHPDGAIAPEKAVVEIKGINHFAFRDVKKTHEVRDSYRAQTNLYIWLMDYERGLIVLKNKNTSELLEIPVERDDKLIKWLLNRFVDTAKFMRKKQLHPRDFTLGSKECYQCNYFGECWSGKEKKRIFQSMGKDEPKVVDLSIREGKEIHNLATEYKKAQKQISKRERVVEQIRDLLLRKLKEFKADGIRIREYHIAQRITMRKEYDRKRLNQLIKQGLVPVSEKPVYQLVVEKLEEES